MSRGRPAGDPAWCVRTDHESGLHQSAALRAGTANPRHGQGEVAVWLQQDGAGPTRVGVNVAFMASATVEIDVADAVRLRDALTLLIKEAVAEQETGR